MNKLEKEWGRTARGTTLFGLISSFEMDTAEALMEEVKRSILPPRLEVRKAGGPAFTVEVADAYPGRWTTIEVSIDVLRGKTDLYFSPGGKKLSHPLVSLIASPEDLADQLYDAMWPTLGKILGLDE